MHTGKIALSAALAAALVLSFMGGPSAAGNMPNKQKRTSALKVPAGSKILLPGIRWAKQKPSNSGRLWTYTAEDIRDRGLAGSPNIEDHIEGLMGISVGSSRRR
jgi:hypothetical protein